MFMLHQHYNYKSEFQDPLVSNMDHRHQLITVWNYCLLQFSFIYNLLVCNRNCWQYYTAANACILTFHYVVKWDVIPSSESCICLLVHWLDWIFALHVQMMEFPVVLLLSFHRVHQPIVTHLDPHHPQMNQICCSKSLRGWNPRQIVVGNIIDFVCICLSSFYWGNAVVYYY